MQKWLLLGFLLSLGSTGARAHVPNLSQIARFQNSILVTRTKPFLQLGNISIAKNLLGADLEWYGPGHYRLKISGTPKTFYKNPAVVASEWTLLRSGDRCSLRVGSQVTQCPKQNFWAALELGATQGNLFDSLLASEVFSAADLEYTESHSKVLTENPTFAQVKTLPDNRLRLVVGKNGASHTAYVEVRGASLQGDFVDTQHPLIQFDQTFLNPMLARWKANDYLYTAEAIVDRTPKEERSRFTAQRFEKLTLKSGDQTLATFSRKPFVEKPFAATPLPEKTPADLSALEANLSLEGVDLLRAVLQTH